MAQEAHLHALAAARRTIIHMRVVSSFIPRMCVSVVGKGISAGIFPFVFVGLKELCHLHIESIDREILLELKCRQRPSASSPRHRQSLLK
eukprot:CAMPEP_0170180808 /NCGR_PEP_ID=MMETSP0040_2-20121228/23091_1 /TAXON_ID=641309 /ORGANISM="Lotharella oceanica, Strain CCMP622" /LENGTH=89 /DNA_ID=CAMNT_0010425585 /DNA_START=10 /DNA_END=279 /DNA_ORIENTATION=+